MKRREAGVPDELIALARVIGEDQKLRVWFRSVEQLPKNLRISSIGHLVVTMTAAGEDPRIVEAVRMLADTNVCHAVREVLDEIYET